MPKHLHTLIRVRHKTRKDLFQCRDPKCTFVRQNIFLEGKLAICSYCGKEYIITREALKLKIPHCQDCTSVSKSDKLDLQKAEEITENLISKLFEVN